MYLARLLLVSLLASCVAHGAAAGGAPAHASFDLLLHRHVEDGRVDYAAWANAESDVAELSAYVDRLEAAKPDQMKRADALAYWINLYNAATLELILQDYPVDSIKDLGGVLSSPWKKKVVSVAGKELSLDEIENQIIRPNFRDPRIHFALNCAALSCPPLRAFAYEGELLEEQLERVTRDVLGDPRFVDFSGCAENSGTIRLTKIFEWYEDDFEAAAGSILAFIGLYADLPESGQCELQYMDYDWSLNRQGR